jgi:hypothetical protein
MRLYLGDVRIRRRPCLTASAVLRASSRTPRFAGRGRLQGVNRAVTVRSLITSPSLHDAFVPVQSALQRLKLPAVASSVIDVLGSANSVQDDVHVVLEFVETRALSRDDEMGGSYGVNRAVTVRSLITSPRLHAGLVPMQSPLHRLNVPPAASSVIGVFTSANKVQDELQVILNPPA